MKKFLSALLVAAMLMSLIIVAAVPASAVDGIWSTYTLKTSHLAEDEGDKNSEPGYEYTDDGLKVISPEDPNWRPYATVQTTDMVDLKDGVYMEVRVDNFTHVDASGNSVDRWYSFHIWDDQIVEPGQVNDEYGYGGEMLMRPGLIGEGDEAKYYVSSFEWYRDVKENERFQCSQDAIDPESTTYDENGNLILTLEIAWDKASEVYVVKVNGITAPDSFCQGITTYFEEECDGQAYVGFSLQNAAKGGKADCTVTKWGTSAADAQVPAGGDSADPVVYSADQAPIASKDTVEAGDPAILITGDKSASDLMSVRSITGSGISITDDYNILVNAGASSSTTTSFKVKNNVSFAAQDFPWAMVITKNLCTCTYVDQDTNGVIDDFEKICNGSEQVNMFYLAGDVIAESQAYVKQMTSIASAMDEDGNVYRCFLLDLSVCIPEGAEPARIHGCRVDAHNLKNTEAGRNEFEICQIGYFANEEDPFNHFSLFLEEIGVGGGEETTAPVGGEETTEPTGGDETTEPTGDVTTESKEEETTEKTEKTTEKDEQTTEKTEQTTKAPVDGGDEGGCASVAGVGVVAVVALAVAGLVSFRKKED